MNDMISKENLKSEIENYRKHYLDREEYDLGYNKALDDVISLIDKMTYEPRSKYSHFVTTYYVGIVPMWKVGDTIAIYEFYSDREGELILGKIVKVDFDDENEDWAYKFDNGNTEYESYLIEEQAYKKREDGK